MFKIYTMSVYSVYILLSMTSLLMHTVAHFTRPSFRPKINKQPIKKFLSLAVSWDFILDSMNFFYKDSDNFWRRKLTLKVRILPFLTTFTQLKAWLKNFLRGSLLILGLKEGLVECATVCVKSEVILLHRCGQEKLLPVIFSWSQGQTF